MGMTYEEILKRAENFKEALWYFMDCHPDQNPIEIKQLMNHLLDALDELPFEN
jgi:hypothetical protein